MKKIPSLYKRDYDGTRLVYNEITPGCEWVLAGEGFATQKWDGTSVLVRDGKMYKRYDAKAGKTPPSGFIPAQPEPDPVTKHWPGWLLVDENNPADKWHVLSYANTLEAYRTSPFEVAALPNGTYELIGPHVQSNPEQVGAEYLMAHGRQQPFDNVPTDFEGLKEWLTKENIEGIVWWRDLMDVDCDKVKIKLKDFGIKRRIPTKV